MALVTSAILNGIRTGFRKNFEDGKTKAEPMFNAVATVVPSTTKSNTYGWLGQWPGFREWIGDRQLKSIKEHAYAISNKDYESTVVVDRNDIEDDSLGVYAPMMNEMGYAARVFPDELVFPLLAAGFTTACYDGQNYFDADHPVNAEVDGSGADTSFSNVIIDGGYTGQAWYLLDTSRSLKPIIFQERKGMQFVAMDNPNDEAVFTNKTFRYGVDCRCNVGFGFWQMAVGVKKTLDYQTIWDAVNQMRGFKADGGRPLGLGKNKLTLVVHSSDYQNALKINNRELIDDGGTSVSNELRGMFNVISPDFL
ncbi:Mu-like prophage major head subunit gpT family protein [uncultured Paraglaciecola sp.]|uniref:Mu-like prophage major head subunit gpT family protein n=1 Tax=uncultured Paraglaciecola sp. TaxID=1765024 RepID=UPI002615AEBB|nr:Mu-like prophage major head subunit gpT family protein [uncultured Paraglaciecola sp.]